MRQAEERHTILQMGRSPGTSTLISLFFMFPFVSMTRLFSATLLSVSQLPNYQLWIGAPAIFVIDLQEANKIKFFKKFFCVESGIICVSIFAYYFLKVHLHHFSKIKSHKEVKKRLKSSFFLIFLLDLDPNL
jgi:hypothetical protein